MPKFPSAETKTSAPPASRRGGERQDHCEKDPAAAGSSRERSLNQVARERAQTRPQRQEDERAHIRSRGAG